MASCQQMQVLCVAEKVTNRCAAKHGLGGICFERSLHPLLRGFDTVLIFLNEKSPLRLRQTQNILVDLNTPGSPRCFPLLFCATDPFGSGDPELKSYSPQVDQKDCQRAAPHYLWDRRPLLSLTSEPTRRRSCKTSETRSISSNPNRSRTSSEIASSDLSEIRSAARVGNKV